METFSFKNYGEQLRKDAGLVPEAVKRIRKVVKLHGPRLVQAEISGLTRPPVDRGTYRQSFKFDDTRDGAVAYNFAPYAPIIEYGRRPGQKAPPIDVIAAWVLRKGIAKKTSRTFATDAQWRAARGIAYAIARQIKRRGLPALMILQHAAVGIDEEIRKEIDGLLTGARA